MIKRIVTSGAKSFVRSGAVTFATVLVMSVTLMIIGSLIFLSAILGTTLATLQDKVDVNVYFVTDAQERDIVSIQRKLEALPEVASVTYSSRDQRLAEFRARHEDDQLTLQALDELSDNPLGASLSIKAQNPSQYEGIVNFLSDDSSISPEEGPIIDSINYYQNKTVIERLTTAINATERAGLVIVILFAIASTIIALATIRLAIYTSRDEIAVMRLVGASNGYIRGPFIVAGILSGLVAALIALAVFYPATWYAGKSLSAWLGGFNLFTYYLSNFALVFGIIVGSGILLGALASWLAVRRYLRV
ncbi:ABC transporter permease [Patescibacteria group bacterium]|nr:ABC transporter permease [Patescibacteria group bacterium]MBU1500461.1 ABC transporter permease [Patescibacteria group bacterium]MBU2080741.1 ABC transporter permease [Patescibacteria group bacterium]